MQSCAKLARFPRTWNKGTQEEFKLTAAERAARIRYLQQRGYQTGEASEPETLVADNVEGQAPSSEGAEHPAAPREPPRAAVNAPPPPYPSN
jgi:hypothetical protein